MDVLWIFKDGVFYGKGSFGKLGGGGGESSVDRVFSGRGY